MCSKARDGRRVAARAAAGLLCWDGGPRDAGRAGPPDADPQTGRAHAPAVEDRRTLRSSEADSASALAPGSPRRRCGGVPLASGSKIRDEGARGSLERSVRPASSPPRHSPNSTPPRRTRRRVRPAPSRVSDRTMVRARARPLCLHSSRRIGSSREEHDAEADCPAHPEAPAGLVRSASGADCPGKTRLAISGPEVCP